MTQPGGEHHPTTSTPLHKPPIHPHEKRNTLNTNPINPSPELAPQLKLLRLSGFLDSLESRNGQAIQGKLAYTEFLAMLVGDEEIGRAHV